MSARSRWSRRIARLKIQAFDALERAVIRGSKHGNHRVYSTSTFPWALALERDAHLIKSELESVLASGERIPAFQEISAEQTHITNDQGWKTFFFNFYGHDVDENCRRCPETARLLRLIPGMKTAFFSILMPGKVIPTHRGPYNGVLRFHLGLKVPAPETACGIVVGGETAHWSEGKALIFDDSFQHRAWNLSNGIRAVLFVDFVRPTRFPLSVLNRLYITLISLSPFIRSAVARQRDWNKVLGKIYEQTGA